MYDRADECAGNSEETMTAADEFAANEIKRLGVLCLYGDEQLKLHDHLWLLFWPGIRELLRA